MSRKYKKSPQPKIRKKLKISANKELDNLQNLLNPCETDSIDDKLILKNYNCLNEINKNFGIITPQVLDKNSKQAERKGVPADEATFQKFYFIKQNKPKSLMFYNVGKID